MVKSNQTQDKKKVNIVAMGEYKNKLEEKQRQIREFEEGPQPLEGCTCGMHTDINEILTKDQVIGQYMEDRRKYVEDLEGLDPMEDYMEVLKGMTGNEPMVRISPATDRASTEHESKHFNMARKFYEDYIVDDCGLGREGKQLAQALRLGYDIYKEHRVLRMVGIYILQRLSFVKDNSDFSQGGVDNLTDKEIFESNITKTQGYTKYINECFKESDENIGKNPMDVTTKTVDSAVGKKLRSEYIGAYEVKVIENHIDVSFKMIKNMNTYHMEQDYENAKRRYQETKDHCSVEDRVEMLIDLELMGRKIDGSYDSDEETSFTVDNSIDKLLKTIGIKEALGKLPTRELEILGGKLK